MNAARLRWQHLTVVAVAAGFLALTACGAQRSLAAGRGTAATGGSGQITTIAGGAIALPSVKPTVLFFFTIGCESCVGAARSLGQAARVLGERADFVAIDLDPNETAGDITEFLDSVKASNVSAASDATGALARRFDVAAVSTVLVVDPAGKVTFRASDSSADTIRATLSQPVAPS